MEHCFGCGADGRNGYFWSGRSTTSTDAAKKSEVAQRKENQQDRIAQGIKSGSLSPAEAARAENRQQGINQQIHADRSANGGKLTGSERAQINKKQNGASRQIYRQKHDGKGR